MQCTDVATDRFIHRQYARHHIRMAADRFTVTQHPNQGVTVRHQQSFCEGESIHSVGEKLT